MAKVVVFSAFPGVVATTGHIGRTTTAMGGVQGGAAVVAVATLPIRGAVAATGHISISFPMFLLGRHIRTLVARRVVDIRLP